MNLFLDEEKIKKLIGFQSNGENNYFFSCVYLKEDLFRKPGLSNSFCHDQITNFGSKVYKNLNIDYQLIIVNRYDEEPEYRIEKFKKMLSKIKIFFNFNITFKVIDRNLIHVFFDKNVYPTVKEIYIFLKFLRFSYLWDDQLIGDIVLNNRFVKTVNAFGRINTCSDGLILCVNPNGFIKNLQENNNSFLQSPDRTKYLELFKTLINDYK